MTTQNLPPDHRRHDIDALRALAFLFVILYHVGMYYVADWPWHLKSPHAAEWLQWPMRILNLWRMDLVFLISGVSLGFLSRGQGTWGLLRSRGLRLMLPLAFGMAVIVPYQAYAQGVANGLVAPGFGAFLLRYLSMAEPWPKRAFDGAEFGITWNHLWYLPYLFTYTALIALTLPLWNSAAGQWLRRGFNGLRGWKLLLLPVVPLLVFTMLLASRFPATHNLVRDFHLHSLYFTMFLYGYWMGVDTGVWKELERLRRVSLALAVAVIAIFIALRTGAKGPASGPLMDTLRMLYLWLAVATILGHGHRHLNRPWPWLRWANESVYPWYVLHQTLIIVGVTALAPLALGPVIEPALLVALTLFGCWALTDGLIRRFNVLRPLFGLKLRRAASAEARPRERGLRSPSPRA
ncbi:Peptidoglycan/LPS O-acetylase OafA/YrhL, contains acyltransferase and SGNH-hydrolase domains [Variovorax sp. YR266]|uniref:acyltransferase family protein n=1 Tax=Variovorax sp. YR266 TaxID=1884386 RepID=UPI000897C93C|nr:acyltransferase family protein [Variovorax sp. YR266]SDZ65092.1 Peptidoglycan/LPS O-acetylase OafA/YrhL, contains acyltransferase and SGNH-hydrolase domains [Variovorax sp. YR266]